MQLLSAARQDSAVAISSFSKTATEHRIRQLSTLIFHKVAYSVATRLRCGANLLQTMTVKEFPKFGQYLVQNMGAYFISGILSIGAISKASSHRVKAGSISIQAYTETQSSASVEKLAVACFRARNFCCGFRS